MLATTSYNQSQHLIDLGMDIKTADVYAYHDSNYNVVKKLVSNLTEADKTSVTGYYCWSIGALLQFIPSSFYIKALTHPFELIKYVLKSDGPYNLHYEACLEDEEINDAHPRYAVTITDSNWMSVLYQMAAYVLKNHYNFIDYSQNIVKP